MHMCVNPLENATERPLAYSSKHQDPGQNNTLFLIRGKLLSGFMIQGKILHTRNHKSENPLENATERPLDNSCNNPLDK